MSSLYTILRIADLTMYVLVFSGMWRHRAAFIESPTEVRLERVGLGALAFASAYATGETLFTGVPGGPRLFMLTVALLYLTTALHFDLLLRIRCWWKARHDG